MAKITRINTTQLAFLHDYLRGTGKNITEVEARKLGIKNLRARMSELRKLGLRVNTEDTRYGTAYTISARDVNGSRAMYDLT
jgi:hypothetical protein